MHAPSLDSQRGVPPQDPVLVDVARAQAAISARDVDGAASLLRARTESDPTRPEPWRALGQLLAQCGHGAQACEALERARDLAPGDAGVEAALATARIVGGDLSAARSAAERAVELDPDLGSANAVLGWCLELAGDRTTAIERYRRAFELDPVGQAGCAYRLERIGGRLGLEELEQRITQLPSDAPDEARRDLAFACAASADASGEYARAFSHAITGNRLTRAPYDAERELARAQRIVETFDARFFEAHFGGGVKGHAPIFVIGLPRSGTSLVEQILDSHPALSGRGEDPYFANLLSRLGAGPSSNGAGFSGFARLFPETWTSIGQGYVTAHPGRTVDKAMALAESLGVIACALPDARLVHVRRDRRDVALSNYLTHFGPFTCTHAGSLDSISFHIERHEALMEHWSHVLPLPILELDYADLVAEPEAQLERLLEFVGVEQHAGCLDFHRNARPVFTASSSQVKRPLHKGALARWRNYEDELRQGLPADWF